MSTFEGVEFSMTSWPTIKIIVDTGTVETISPVDGTTVVIPSVSMLAGFYSRAMNAASAAEDSEDAAADSAVAAEASASGAADQRVAAEQAATDAAASESVATTQAGIATTKASEASASASSASASATTATTKAQEASTSAATAQTAASAATTKASEAVASADSASVSATAASGSASTASTKASEASASASAAQTSATSSANSATAASGSASASAASASTATAAATTATTKASEAASSATSANTSALAASSSATSAGASADTATSMASNALASAGTAQTSANTATSKAAEAVSAAASAGLSETAAETAADLAQDWATKMGSEVVTGEGYSAKKHATDAASSASGASTSASQAATSASAASTSASTASTKANEASSSAGLAATSATTATTKAAEAVTSATAAAGSATNSLNSANASAASAALAAEIVNISSVQFFTNPLAKAIRVALGASASVRGPMVLDNANLDMGTNDFTVFVQKRISTTRPAATEVLMTKYDSATGTGIALELLTTGFLRLYINRFQYMSTAALPSATNVEPVIMVPTVHETATTAGSVTFVVDGVQLGDALAIAVPAEKVTNGTFDTDLTGWTLSSTAQGTITWASGKMRAERTGTNGCAGVQAVSMAAGETRVFQADITFISGAGSAASLHVRSTEAVSSTALATSASFSATSGTATLSYTSPTAQTVYLHARVVSGNGIYDFDNITSVPSTYSVDNAANLHVLGTSSTTTEGDYLDSGIYNRALTVAECLAHCVRGPSVRDVGASQAAFYTTDFSAGTNSWSTAGSTTVAGNIDGIGGKDNNLRVTTDGTSSARVVRTISILGVKNGKLILELYRPSSNVTCAAVDVRLTVGTSSSGTVSLGDYLLPADTWTTISIDLPVSVVTNSATAISLYFADAAGATSNNTSGDVFYVASGGTFTQTGLVAHWPAFNAQTNTGQLADRSGNKNHLLLPASGATILGDRRPEIQILWENTWASTSELQYVPGVNQAVYPANFYIEGILLTPSATTTAGFTIGNGSNAAYYATVSGPLTAGVPVFVPLTNRYPDGSNLKLTITPMATTTCTLAVTVFGRLLGGF